MPNSPKSINMTNKTIKTEEMVNLPSIIEGYGQLPLQAYRSHIVHFTLTGMHLYRISIISTSLSMILVLLCDGEGRRAQQRRRVYKKRDVRDWSKSIGGGAFGNMVDKNHMAHPLPSAQK